MTPAEKRAEAEKMRRLAAEATEPGARNVYRVLAADWDRLAREAEELQRRLDGAPKPGRW